MLAAAKAPQANVESGDSRDRRDHSARILGLTPVREEALGFTGGTESAIEDTIRAQAGVQQLAAIRFRQIKRWVRNGNLSFREIRRKLIRDVRSYAITTATYTGPDGREQIGRIAFEIRRHFTSRHPDDLGRRSSPAGMDRSNCPRPAIQQEYGNTVSSPDAHGCSDFVCNDRVTFLLAIFKTGRVQNLVGMYLSESNSERWISSPAAKAVLLPTEVVESGTAINAIGINPKGRTHRAPTRSRDSLRFRSERYQARVERRPSSNVNRGAWPSSLTAAVVSACECFTSPERGGP